jgi:hypothetical protein
MSNDFYVVVLLAIGFRVSLSLQRFSTMDASLRLAVYDNITLSQRKKRTAYGFMTGLRSLLSYTMLRIRYFFLSFAFGFSFWTVSRRRTIRIGRVLIQSLVEFVPVL